MLSAGEEEEEEKEEGEKEEGCSVDKGENVSVEVMLKGSQTRS